LRYSLSSDLNSPLSVCVFLGSNPSAEFSLPELNRDRYRVTGCQTGEAFCKCIEAEKHALDCLVLQNSPELLLLTNWLHGQAVMLPAVIIVPDPDELLASGDDPPLAISPTLGQSHYLSSVFIYHIAEVVLPFTHVDRIHHAVEQAIAQFLSLSHACRINTIPDAAHEWMTQDFLLPQQRRLTEKLKERLGYLGVYYKRNPQNFLRHLSPARRQELVEQLKEDYRDIVLHYFLNDGSLNQRIDDFVNTVFFADVPVSQVVEIHMELIDELSKQLKLEGRSEEILLDYRLTLIDAIAHLCEMYRRSIPRES